MVRTVNAGLEMLYCTAYNGMPLSEAYNAVVAKGVDLSPHECTPRAWQDNIDMLPVWATGVLAGSPFPGLNVVRGKIREDTGMEGGRGETPRIRDMM